MSIDYSNVVPALERFPTARDDEFVIASGLAPQSNLARSVYCILGIPIDAIDLVTVIRRVETAAAARATFLVSTPNLNFLVTSLFDAEFRESVLDSDLCPPDGAPILWVARLLGLPIRERAAGADLLERLQSRSSQARPMKLFLFGGANGVAAAAAEKLNRQPGNLSCVGTMNPGFGDLGEISRDHLIEAINSSGADFLVVSLGAKKGQLWLQRNHDRLTIPIRSHLGAAINFQAGTVKRAPRIVSAWGFEWLWRIKEERYLWKRYRDDGLVFLRLLLTRVLPLAVLTVWQRLRFDQKTHEFRIRKHDIGASTILIDMSGLATETQVSRALSIFREAVNQNKDVVIDLSRTSFIDARFLGLLLMLRKELRACGANLRFTAVPRAIQRIFRLNEVGYLLSNSLSG
jgi:N-acetylglucosaminyldiphosphoundecaprenol N-acetyl-beta-D-mannosaminyltransferase